MESSLEIIKDFFLNNNFSDTLRYFYSAILQGFAAIIALGGMFYVYYKQNIVNRKNEILKEYKNYFNMNIQHVRASIEIKGIHSYVLDDLEAHKGNLETNDRLKALKLLSSEYEKISEKEKSIYDNLTKLTKKIVVILIISMFGLFFVGYHRSVDFVLIVVGFLLILLSINCINQIKNFILSYKN
jgi:ABC-type multidrug transport system fused ATPase/permease subunit